MLLYMDSLITAICYLIYILISMPKLVSSEIEACYNFHKLRKVRAKVNQIDWNSRIPYIRVEFLDCSLSFLARSHGNKRKTSVLPIFLLYNLNKKSQECKNQRTQNYSNNIEITARTSTSETAPHSLNSFLISATEKDHGRLSTNSFLLLSGFGEFSSFASPSPSPATFSFSFTSSSSATVMLSAADCNWKQDFFQKWGRL